MKNKSLYLFVLGFLFLQACEQEFLPDGVDFEEEIVVEGYIEVGPEALPTYVLLTKTIEFFGDTIQPNQLNELFVRDAIVTVTDEAGNEVQLTQLCLDALPTDVQEQVAAILGIEIDPNQGIEVNICAYLDLLGEVEAEEGKSYDLRIEAGDEVLTSTTTIPNHVPLDSVYFTTPPGNTGADTLAEMNCVISDPSGPNYYRFLTAENDGPLIATFGTVTDDVIFDGQTFNFPINKAEDPDDEDLDFETFGLWHVGDTATLKWITLDEEHFRFWETFEANRNNQGPFATYTRVSFNIEGGLGIWGGLSSSIYTEEVIIE